MEEKRKVTCTSRLGCVRGSVGSLMPGLEQAFVTWVQQHSVTAMGMHCFRSVVMPIVLEDGPSSHSS